MSNESDNTQPLNPFAQKTLRQLMQVFFDFERRLAQVPIIERLYNDSFTRDDYRNLLLNMRQQVIEGSRWIARCASSFDAQHSDIRATIIEHAFEEHRDYRILEQDYTAVGGNVDDIQQGEKNIGSEALHGYLMYRASCDNPFDLIGAMWIIEGLGEKMATEWADRIDALIDTDKATRFLRYHGQNDDKHMEKFYQMLERVCDSEPASQRIIKNARVVARLYRLQLEECDSSQVTA